MLTTPRAIAPALAATVAVGVGAPAASASTPSTPTFTGSAALWPLPQTAPFNWPLPSSAGISSPAGPCGAATGQEGVGATGGTTAQICTGAGPVFVGPAIGSIAAVIGPTIIGPAVVGNLNVSAGSGNLG